MRSHACRPSGWKPYSGEYLAANAASTGASTSFGSAVRGTSPTTSTRPDSSRSEEHTSELQSLMRISYAVFCLKKKNHNHTTNQRDNTQVITHDRDIQIQSLSH